MEGNAYGNLEHSVATTVNAHLDSKEAIVKVYILLSILSKSYKLWHKGRRNGHTMCEHLAILCVLSKHSFKNTILDKICGHPQIQPNVNHRIYQGVEAVPHSWPWVGAISQRMTDW